MSGSSTLNKLRFRVPSNVQRLFILTITILTTTAMAYLSMPLQKASAWSSNPLPTCSDWATGRPVMYIEQFNKLQSNYPTSSRSYVIWGYKESGNTYNTFVISHSTDPDVFEFDTSGGIHNFHKKFSGNYYESAIRSPNAHTGAAVGTIQAYAEGYINGASTYTGYGTTYPSLQAKYNVTAPQCIVGVSNVEYRSTYTGATYTDVDPGDPVSPAVEECPSWNVTCYVSNAFQGLSTTIQDLGTAIVRGIAALFIPKEDYFQTLYTDFDTEFSEKLGFLYFPIDFIQDMFYYLGDCSGTCPDTSFNVTMFGQTHSLDMTLGLLPDALEDFVLATIRIGTVITLIFGLYHQYRQVVENHTEHPEDGHHD